MVSNIVVYYVLAESAIVIPTTVYSLWLFVIRPFFKFRKTKKKGYYVDIHKFDDDGTYNGTVSNLSLDDMGSYVKKTFFGWTEPKTLEERIEGKMESAVDKTADKMIDLMLQNKDIQRKMQLQVFRTLKTKLGVSNGKKQKANKN